MTVPKRLLIALGVTFWALVALLAALAALVLFMEGPGGMGSSYAVKDGDPRLTGVARSAAPILVAVTRYRRDHAKSPELPSDLAPYLPGEVIPTGRDAAIRGWIYNVHRDGDGYSLWHKLGWDPSLSYRFEGGRGAWVFDPGDGTNSKEFELTR